MRKILLVLSLSLMLVLSACSSGGSSTCTLINLTPGVTYRIFYTSPVAPPITGTAVANANGSVTVPSFGHPCWALVAVAVLNSNLTLAASPSSIYLPSPPATVTITGQSFDATYGMPMVEYFDGGFLVGSVYASSVASDGTSLVAYTPNLWQAYSGTYQVRVTNKTSQGYYVHTVGFATVTAWGRDRVDSDGDGWYDDQDCDPWDPFRYDNCYCGGGNEPITICP